MPQNVFWFSTGAELAEQIIIANENASLEESERRAEIARLSNRIITDGEITQRTYRIVKRLALGTTMLLAFTVYSVVSMIPNMYVQQCANKEDVFYRWALFDRTSVMRIGAITDDKTGNAYGPICSWGSDVELSKAVLDYRKKLGL